MTIGMYSKVLPCHLRHSHFYSNLPPHYAIRTQNVWAQPRCRAKTTLDFALSKGEWGPCETQSSCPYGGAASPGFQVCFTCELAAAETQANQSAGSDQQPDVHRGSRGAVKVTT